MSINFYYKRGIFFLNRRGKGLKFFKAFLSYHKDLSDLMMTFVSFLNAQN